jgi:3-hydroxyisobutyrate dehydrogenase
MATRLVGWPGGLVVCDLDPAATAPFAEAGADVAPTAAAVAERASVISVMVANDAQVEAVLNGPDGILSMAKPGTVVAVHSTVDFATPARLAAVAAEQGVELVDAPVSGGFMGAHSGELAVMVGGSDEAFAAVAEPFARFAVKVLHVGPIGAGTQFKLARNLVTFASYAAVGEAMRLAAAAGVDLQLLGDVIRHTDKITGGPGSILVRTMAGALPEGDGLRPIFEHTRTLGEKDLDLALALGDQLGVDLPVTALARTKLAEALGVPHDD